MEIRFVPWGEFQKWSSVVALSESAGWFGNITAVALAGAEEPPDEIRALPILSRLPLRTQAEDAWLSALRKAMEWCASQGWTIIGSAGMTGWDYSSWFAGKIGARLRLVLPPQKAARLPVLLDELIDDLQLSPERTTFIAPILESPAIREERFHLRDRLMLALAHHRLPIAVRKRGFWEKILAEATGVDMGFRVSYPKPISEPWREHVKIVDATQAPLDGDWLVHWTRGAYGPWFGETTADYFETLTKAESGNPRDAIATLRYIAGAGILRGQGRMVRGGTPLVSFTALDNESATDSGRWRSWLKRVNWEPYGIALRREVLERLGGRRVIYGDDELHERLTPDERPFYQFIGNANFDWQSEAEWRLIGDLDLTTLGDEVILIVPTQREAEELRRELSFRVAALQHSPPLAGFLGARGGESEVRK
jgi:hypothetical protein